MPTSLQYYTELTLCHPGGGGLRTHILANRRMLYNRCLKAARMCLTFQMMTLEKYLTKKFEIFFRGYSLFGPSKCSVSKNDHPSTANDPTFLLQNPFTLKKCGCLQKTRAQSVKIHLFALQTKNAVNQRVFKIFPKFFFYMVSYYPLILYGV